MSESPNDLLGLRSRLAAETGVSPVDIGIAADESHLQGGGYHCGSLDLRRINAVGRDDYSIRQPRDRAYYNFEIAHGSNFASAMDMADDWPRGGRSAWIRFNNLLRARLGASDPALAAVRGINYTPDGTTKRRFDCLTHQESSTTDTVTWHTHIEWWRDTIATNARAQSINRIVQIAVAARDNTPLGLPPATPIPISEADMIFTVTGVPAGATDIAGTAVPENGQCLATPNGPFNLTGAEFFSLPAGAQPVRIRMSWSRLLVFCDALRPPAAGAASLQDAAQQALQSPGNGGSQGR
jgi:hypothetical protein